MAVVYNRCSRCNEPSSCYSKSWYCHKYPPVKLCYKCWKEYERIVKEPVVITKASPIEVGK
jgi:hypothetical protein